MTQEELAELMATAPQYVSALERGEKNVTINTLVKAAEALNIDLFDMLCLGKGDPAKILDLSAIILHKPETEKEKLISIFKSISSL